MEKIGKVLSTVQRAKHWLIVRVVQGRFQTARFKGKNVQLRICEPRKIKINGHL